MDDPLYSPRLVSSVLEGTHVASLAFKEVPYMVKDEATSSVLHVYS